MFEVVTTIFLSSSPNVGILIRIGSAKAMLSVMNALVTLLETIRCGGSASTTW